MADNSAVHIGILLRFSAVVGGQAAAIAPLRQSGTKQNSCLCGRKSMCVCVRVCVFKEEKIPDDLCIELRTKNFK